MRRAWDWLIGLPPWQRALLLAGVVFALFKAWDVAATLIAGALDFDAIAGRAKGAARRIGAVGQRAKAVGRTADAARDLLDSVGDMADAHATEDAKADAELAHAQGEVADARHADAPADDLSPQLSKYLGEL